MQRPRVCFLYSCPTAHNHPQVMPGNFQQCTLKIGCIGKRNAHLDYSLVSSNCHHLCPLLIPSLVILMSIFGSEYGFQGFQHLFAVSTPDVIKHLFTPWIHFSSDWLTKYFIYWGYLSCFVLFIANSLSWLPFVFSSLDYGHLAKRTQLWRHISIVLILFSGVSIPFKMYSVQGPSTLSFMSFLGQARQQPAVQLLTAVSLVWPTPECNKDWNSFYCWAPSKWSICHHSIARFLSCNNPC